MNKDLKQNLKKKNIYSERKEKKVKENGGGGGGLTSEIMRCFLH